MRRWLLVDDRPRRGCSWPTRSPSTRRSTSAPTTIRTASIYWLLTGLHGAHVTAGLAAMALLFVRSVRAGRHAAIASWAGGVSLFWHLVDVIWVVRVPRPSGSSDERTSRRCWRSPRPWSPAVGGLAVARAAPSAGGRRAAPQNRSGAELYAAQCATLPRRRRHAASRTAVRRCATEGRAAVDFVLRTGRMPLADPDMQASRGPVRYSEDEIRRPRRLRRRVRRRPGHPRRRPGTRRPRRRRRAVPPELRGLPRRVRLRRGDRRRSRGAVADGVDADRDRRGDPRRPGRDAGVRRRSATRTSTTSPPTSSDLQERRRPRRSTTSAAPVRSPRASPPGCSACSRSIALTRWIGTPHEGRDAPLEPRRPSPPRTADVTVARRRPAGERAGVPRGDRLVRRRHRRRASPRPSATAPTTPATCSASASPPRSSASASGWSAGPSTSTSTSTSCRSASRCRSRRAARRSCTRSSPTTRAAARPAQAAARRCSAGRSSAWSSGSSARSARSARSRAASAARTSWSAGRAARDDRRARRSTLEPQRRSTSCHRVPRGPHRRRRLAGRAAAAAARAADRSGPSTAAPSRAGSPTPRSAPTPAARSACSASTTGRPTRCASSSARATSRCSTRVDGARPVGGPATRSLPQLALDVDAEGFLVAHGDFDRPVGPLAWDEA